MPKTRLTNGVRDQLVRLAERSLVCEAEAAAERAAYDAVSPLVMALVLERFPARDMRILKKYEVARTDTCIRLVNSGGGIELFKFHDDDAPVVPSRYCASRNFIAPDETLTALGAWKKARDAHNAAKKAAVLKYRAVINGARNAEDILEVWPAASAVLDRFIEARQVARSLPTASDAAIAFVRETNAAATA
jgi:hypothetical protein